MDHQDWTDRYSTNNTVWDLGKSPPPLSEFINNLSGVQKVVIPGCGRGYEIRDFAESGHEVSAVDFSEGAISAARTFLDELADSIIHGDFFNDNLLEKESFDICYERTFLCSLPAELRLRYGSRVASLLKPGGLLVGIFHYGESDRDARPYPMNEHDQQEILRRHFDLELDHLGPSGIGAFKAHIE